MRATIRQVAERAGVSAMTVSRILRGQTQRVAPQTAARVLEAARELDYIAVRPVLQNKQATTHVIGVVFDGIQSVKGFVGSSTFEGLRDAAMQNGFDLLIHAERRDVLQREEASFLDRRSDGVIFVSPRQRHELLSILVRHEFPVVSCYSTDVPQGVATIAPDNRRAMRIACKYLHERGHSRIALFAGPQWHSDARERLEAWQEAMKSLHLQRFSDMVETSEGETANHTQAVARLLERKPTAVVCHNDFRALLLKEAAQARGLDVPNDLSIIGMDDMPETAGHGLTSVHVSFEEVGRTALHALSRLILGESVSDVSQRIKVHLAERQSVAVIKG